MPVEPSDEDLMLRYASGDAAAFDLLYTRHRAGVFRYARSPYAETRLRDGFKFVARMIAGPSAEQGLLIARDHYERLGGYRPDSRRSETRLLRQLGRSSRTQLRSRIMVVA